MSATLLTNSLQYNATSYPQVVFPIEQILAEEQERKKQKQFSKTPRQQRAKASDSEPSKKLTAEQVYKANASNRKSREDELASQLRSVLSGKEPLPWSPQDYVSDCRQGNKGADSFLRILYCSLRYFVGDTKLPYASWVDIIKEWNATLNEPFLLDENCKPADSFWRLVTYATIHIASDAIAEYILEQQGIKPLDSKPRSSQVRMMQAMYCTEGLSYLRTLNHRHIVLAVRNRCNQVINQGADQREQLIKQIEKEIASNYGELSDYTSNLLKSHTSLMNTETTAIKETGIGILTVD